MIQYFSDTVTSVNITFMCFLGCKMWNREMQQRNAKALAQTKVPKVCVLVFTVAL